MRDNQAIVSLEYGMAVPATPPLVEDHNRDEYEFTMQDFFFQNTHFDLHYRITTSSACLCQCHQVFFIGAVIFRFATGEKMELFLYIRTHLDIRY